MSRPKTLHLIIALTSCTLLLGQSLETATSQLQTDQDQVVVSILSQNLWGLPIWLPGMDQQNRYTKMAKAILTIDADIVCLQESFAHSLRKKVLPKLKTQYHLSSEYSCNERIFWPLKKDCYGGLMTLSKYPLTSEEFYLYPQWNDMRIEERIGKKGFLISTIDINGIVVKVINTHLYAGSNPKDEIIRYRQISFMNDILIAYYDLTSTPIFLVGDLNVCHPDLVQINKTQPSAVYEFVTNKMDLLDPMCNLPEDCYTIDHRLNKYTPKKAHLEKLDYCLFRQTNQVKITWLSSDTVLKEDDAISDHLGWLSHYQIKKTRAVDHKESILASKTSSSNKNIIESTQD